MPLQYCSILYLFAFLLPVFLIYNIVPVKFRWIVLLVASYTFYFINSSWLVVFLLITTAAVYFCGLKINKINDDLKVKSADLIKEEKKILKAKAKKKKSGVMIITLIFIIGILAVLKYTNFVSGSLNSLLNLINIDFQIPAVNLLLPLGISYYTLQAASYIIDVERGKYKATKNIGKVALFLSFFPQIVEGPIGRFDLLADQLYEGHKFNYDKVTKALQLILWGMFKKLLIADRCNILVANVFEKYDGYSGYILLIGGIYYTIQLYMEFSGVIDIVTGSAELFGINLSPNFERPFFSKTIAEFWRRWHITLGTWLKDYVFYSVSLSHGFGKFSKWASKHLNKFFASVIPSMVALFCVWVCNGIWHGAGWKYLCYGMYYYIIMQLGVLTEPLFAKLYDIMLIDRKGPVYKLIQIIRTNLIVVFGMIMFRADDLNTFGVFVKKIFTEFLTPKIRIGMLDLDWFDHGVIIFGVITVFVIGLIQEKHGSVRELVAKKKLPIRWTLYILLIVCIVVFGAYGEGYHAVDPIYGRF